MADVVQGQADRKLRHTLRLALAMRGGVSLAVWIGGAVAEIDVLRRTRPAAAGAYVRPPEGPANDKTQPDRMQVYADLLHLAAYDGVEVDILAGASAGGLNAVLYGTAQSLGVTIDHLDGLWRELGGMWNLMRSPTQFARASSVLQGDQYFYARMYQQLTTLSQRDVRKAPRGGDVTIDLAATLLADADGGRALGNRAQFHFVGRDAALRTEFNDLPRVQQDGGIHEEDTPYVDISLKRLALAARSTSSFPGAFEPSAIYSNKGVQQGEMPGTDARAGLGDTLLPVMWGNFSAARPGSGDYEKEPFYVVDGGVFDNIPVDRALRAIELAPAKYQTSRRLLYLDPDPPPRPTTQPGKRAGTDWLPVILRARGLQKRVESAGDELQLVRDHNDRVSERNARYDELAGVLRAGGAGRIGRDLDAYVGFRVARDTTTFGRLLTEPTRVLVGKRVTSQTRPPITNDQALHITGQVRRLYETAEVSNMLTWDVRALIDTANLLIAWVRALQLASGLEVLAEEKEVLYRLLFTANLLRQESDAAILAHSWHTPPRDDDARAAFLASQGYLAITYDPAQFDVAFGGPVGDREFYAALSALRTTSDHLLLDALWDVAARAHATIRRRVVTPSRGPVPPIYLVLAGLDLGQFPVQSLHRLFVPAGGVPGTASEVSYHEVTGGQGSPLEEEFETLRRLEARAQLTVLLKGKDLPPDAGLFTSQSKLAGNTLANFGGFLSAEWRLNDWRWGRLDAAAALVDVITANARDDDFDARAGSEGLWDRYGAAEGDRKALLDAMKRRLQRLLVLSEAGTEAAVDGSIKELSTGGQTLADLRPSYKLGLASRAVHLVHRSLWPTKFGVGGVATAMGLTALRPFATLAPLALQPVRAALVLMLTLLTASVLSVAHAGPGPTRFVAWAALGCGVYLAATAAQLGSTWQRVGADAGDVRKALAGFEAAGRAFRKRRLTMLLLGVLFLVAGAVGLVVGGDLDDDGSQLNVAGALALVAALLGLTVAVKRRAMTVFATRHVTDRLEVAGWVVTALCGVGAVAAGYLDEWRDGSPLLFADGPDYWQAVLLALVVVALTFLVLAGWADQSQALSYAAFAAVLALLVLTALIEAWDYATLATLVILVGVLVAGSSLKWGPKYEQTRLIFWGTGLGLSLVAAGLGLWWWLDGSDSVDGVWLARGLVVLGALVVALGMTAGKKWGFQVFGTATGIEIALAGVWMLLADPRSGVTDIRLLWWAYGAWFVVMSLATLYIPNRPDEPATARPPKDQ